MVLRGSTFWDGLFVGFTACAEPPSKTLDEAPPKPVEPEKPEKPAGPESDAPVTLDAKVESDDSGPKVLVWALPGKRQTFNAAVSNDLTLGFSATEVEVFADSLAAATGIALRRSPTMATAHTQHHLKVSSETGGANVALLGKGAIARPLELALQPTAAPAGASLYVLSAYQEGSKFYLEATAAQPPRGDGKVVVPVKRWGFNQLVWMVAPPPTGPVELFDQETLVKYWHDLGKEGEPAVQSLSGVMVAMLGMQGETPAASPLCKEWADSAEIVGKLPLPQLKEASGLALSSDKTELYHVNDSGSQAVVVVTNLTGALRREVAITGAAFVDTEALALGPCPKSVAAEGSCLFIADTGNNKLDRKVVLVHVVKEAGLAGASAEVAASLPLVYKEDGAWRRDSEAMAVHPVSGQVFVATKGLTSESKSYSWENIYRAPASAESATVEAPALMTVLGSVNLIWKPTAPPVTPATLDVKSLTSEVLKTAPLGGHFSHSKITTDMVARPDGKAVAVLTYGNVIEFAVDLSQIETTFPDGGKPGIDYRIVALRNPGAQQEALTYDVDGRSLLITSEATPASGEPELRRLRCVK